MMNPLTYCAKCRRFFIPTEPNQCLCENCANNDASKSVLWWFAAFAGTVIAILIYMVFK